MDDADVSSQVKRAFSRYEFVRGIESTGSYGLARRRRPMVLTVMLVGLAATALWAASGTSLNPQPSVAFAGWGATPSLPDAELAASGTSPCHVDGEAMELVAQDQRGNAAALLYRGGNELAICLVVRDSAGTVVATTTGFSRLAEFEGTLSVDTILSQPRTGQNAGIRIVAGRIDADVTRVDVTREDDASVEATVKSGSFLAWWPTDEDALEVTAKDARGATLARVEPEN